MFVVASGVRARSVPTAGRARGRARPRRRRTRPTSSRRGGARADGRPIECVSRRGWRCAARTGGADGDARTRRPRGTSARRSRAPRPRPGGDDERRRGEPRGATSGDEHGPPRRQRAAPAAAIRRARRRAPAGSSRELRLAPAARCCTTKRVSSTIPSVLRFERGSSNASAAGAIPARRRIQAAWRASTEWMASAGTRYARLLDQRRLRPCRRRPRGPRRRPRSCGSAPRPRSRRGSRSAGA